jgi:ubiquinone biosynthesis protein
LRSSKDSPTGTAPGGPPRPDPSRRGDPHSSSDPDEPRLELFADDDRTVESPPRTPSTNPAPAETTSAVDRASADGASVDPMPVDETSVDSSADVGSIDEVSADRSGDADSAPPRSSSREPKPGSRRRKPRPEPDASPDAAVPDPDPPTIRIVEAERAEETTADPDATVPEPETVIRVRRLTREERAEARAKAAPEPTAPPPTTTTPAPAPARTFVFDPLRPYRGVGRRFFTVYRHTLGLLAGAAVAYVRALPRERRHGLKSWFPRLSASLFWPFLDREIRRLPFPQQLRRRLEILGPTYIKLGQIMAIREDLLPRSITTELQNLFDRLPAIPFAQVREIIERSLGHPVETLFRRIAEEPLGSASIAQAHVAETLDGEEVVLKVIKPGVREMIESDLTLLGMAGVLLQWALPRYQPRQIIAEFSAYTRKEVDYTFEADNAETFAANFRDTPDVVFPRIRRDLSAADVLTMELIRGFKPGSPPTETLTADERARVIDLGAAAIIRMLYRDGFFHADLHAGNLMILPGKRVRVAFIDLGMVGRFEDRTRRQMLYYFHALVTGDVDGATRYLVDMATVGKGGDPQGFRRAVADLGRRFVTHASRGDISIAQLILESVGLGGRYRVFFPVEMTLMVKALVTFEGVGRMLDPKLDVASVSQKHVSKIFQQQFDPRSLLRDVLRGSPELVDMAVRLPQLLSAGFKFADEHLNNRQPANPLAGIKESILAAACIVGGVLAVIQGASPLLSGGMFVLAVILYVFGR